MPARVATPGPVDATRKITTFADVTACGDATACGGVARSDTEAAAGAGAIAAAPPAGEVTPREAAFLLALLSASASWSSRREPGSGARQIAARIAIASPADCLDAVFAAVPQTSPKDLIRRIRATATWPSARPFLDDAYYAGIARWLGCAFTTELEPLDPHTVAGGGEGGGTDSGAGSPHLLRVACEGEAAIAIAPPPAWLPSLGRIACLKPDLMRKVVITTPTALKAARGDRSLQLETGRLMPLHGVPRQLLADQVATRGQVAALVAALGLLAVGLVGAPVPVFAIFLLTVNLALLAHASTRGVALFDRTAPRASRRPRAAHGQDEELPVYSILVPLYREHGVVPQLAQALAAIDYPRERLDIQFLLEADDTETLAAVERCAAGLGATITVVPPGGPRTKPKALNVGLRRACGEIVTVFDAEDRPDPQQLRLAAAAFRAAPRSLAVLQARLIIDHAGENWLTAMFAIEYAIQFDALLPMVARRDGLFLLGGTSNHFRRSALVEVGGWDPYNVTEDADLSVRLKRFGYRLGTLASHTHEEAPISLGAWMKQRSRWAKGWIQTWLVHMRSPARLVRDLGIVDTLLLQVFILGGFLAVLAHPAFVVALILHAFDIWSLSPDGGLADTALLAASLAIFVLGYGANFALGAILIRRRGLSVSPWTVVGFPLYWFLLFSALVVAVCDLVRRPHFWSKTEHGLAARPAMAGAPVRPDQFAARGRRALSAARSRRSAAAPGGVSLIDPVIAGGQSAGTNHGGRRITSLARSP